MNQHEEVPKLPKLPFIVGDLLLIATAFLIVSRSGTPLGSDAIIAATVCVVLGAALLVIPFMADYARRSDAALAERQDQIAALARTTSDSAEQLSIVASGLNGIAESSKHNLAALEKLPAQLIARIDDITQQLASSALAAHSSAKEDVARLEATADKLTLLLSKLESAAKLQTNALSTSEQDLAATLTRATAQLDAFIAKTSKKTDSLAKKTPPSTSLPVVSVVEIVAPTPAETLPSPEPSTPEAPISETTVIATSRAAEPADEAPAFTPAEPSPGEVPVNPDPARARKPKPADDILDLGLTPDAAESSESSVTSDGFTRLIATAYIGIGNKLYLRGDGPGLSWEKGIPLQFVSIGKWRWESPDATTPVSAKLYKNDQVECTGLGTLLLEPGRQHEVNAGF